MSHLVYRQIGHDYPVARAASGIFIEGADGRRYIDACGGAAVSSLGHNHPTVLDAMRAAVGGVDYVHTSFFTTEATEALADDLIAHAPKGMSHAVPVTGGSEAVETALKLARQCAIERGQLQRTQVISRRQSYHGNTMGALSVSGNEGRRQTYAPMLFPAHFIDPCFDYRFRAETETAEAYGRRAADALEEKIQELGPDNVLAFIAETVVGATAGAVAPAPGYFRRIREICDRHGVLLILDEVMCGMGRTGTLHAVEQEGITPDIMAVAKGLGGGYVPIGAVMASRAVYDSLAAGSKSLMNGFTYMGHPFACAVAVAVQKAIRDEDLLANVRKQGDILRGHIIERLGQHANVGDIRGRGLFWAVEFVEDRASKKPFEPGAKIHERVKRAAMEQGLLVYAMGGTIDGINGNHIMLAPPYIIDDAAADDIVGRLQAAVGDALAGLHV